VGAMSVVAISLSAAHSYATVGDCGDDALRGEDDFGREVAEKGEFRYTQCSSVSDQGKVEGSVGEMAGALTKTLARH
jgi:hypothetical protein